MAKEKVRSIFISDVHLGSRFCHAKELDAFLDQYSTENLYLVGDIFDGWKLKRSFYWNNEYSFLIRRIIGMIKKKNTRVVYVIGNHDEFLRDYNDLKFDNLEVVNECVHTTLDDRKLLIVHGDMFDHITKHFKWVQFMGDHAYTIALFVNRYLNFLRRQIGCTYWSFSQMLKAKVKKAVCYIDDFENFVIKYTQKKDCEGVVCGHIHVPIIKQLGDITYYNCGDWVENCTAIIEDFDGNLSLVRYDLHKADNNMSK